MARGGAGMSKGGVMGRPLAPCGTPAAYRRHKKRGEDVDPACAQANRDHVGKYKKSKRESAAAVVKLAVSSEPPVESVDEVEDLRENLRIVKAAMQDATPREVAALSKRRQEIVGEIARLSRRVEKSGGLLDELAARREARLSGAAN